MIDPALEGLATGEFHRRKVLRIGELVELLGCSIPTVRNRLRRWSAFTSYNHNGAYYTLPAIPRFDEHGLWRYKGVGFSQHGTLKRTVLQLVRDSPAGLEGAQIGRLVGLPPRSFLSHVRSLPGLTRERLEGRFVYFCDEPPVLARQRQAREQRRPAPAAELPSDSVAVAVLADLINHPDSTLQGSSRRLARKGIPIRPAAIARLLEVHGVKKNFRV